MGETPSSSDLHFEQLLKLRPFEVFIANNGDHLVSTLSLPQHPVANCGQAPMSRVYAYLICAVLNTAVHPDAIDVLQGIIDDDGPGVSLKEQSDRWSQRLDDAETVIAKSRAALSQSGDAK